MKLTIRRFETTDLPAVNRFNQRLEEAGEPHRVHPETPETPGETAPISGRLFLALEDEELRGSVWLHEQDFWFGGEKGKQMRGGFLRLPLSESVVNPAYRGVPSSLIMQVLRVQPRLMALGLGHHDTAFARLLAAFRWTGVTVPFYFTIVKPVRVLRELSYGRRDPRRRLAMDVAAFSGLGWLGGQVLNVSRALKLGGFRAFSAEVESVYGGWTDELWQRARSKYDLVPARDSATLNKLHPHDFYHGFHRLRVRRDGRDVGMANVLRADLSAEADDKYFGQLRVGLIADVFGDPGDAPGITAAATQYLLDSDVDLIVSFQQHPAWQAAVRNLGFFSGPSTFCWYRGAGVQQLLPAGPVLACHLNRADAEGPKWF